MIRDVAVVGAGHAGIEAALAASRKGCSVVLITASLRRIGEMSCNPAIGGIAKGTLVREIDVLGGAMAESADATSLQHRMLNRRKGPAVWGPRVQSDSQEYAKRQRSQLDNEGIDLIEDEVVAMSGQTEHPEGFICRKSGEIKARAMVIAAGTFLAGRLFRGDERWKGGRIGDISADSLESDLRRRMFHVKRFKTGTSPRIVRNSVDLDCLDVQEEDTVPFRFSFREGKTSTRKEKCFTVRTCSATRDAAEKYMERSPLFSGSITGRGPRYCPSFEDKVVRFPDRTGHLIHVEPTGFRSRLLYLNGLSTSLPREAQEEMVRSLPGFSGALIAMYGYAVEYSSLENSEFYASLLMRRTDNVFAAGQLLGTSGYEEAAALGLLAGANAARAVAGEEPLTPCRADSYLGVMVDDLVNIAQEEPYRLFSSRAENRLQIRQDNAISRVMPFAVQLGTSRGNDQLRWERREKESREITDLLMSINLDGRKAIEICRRPEADVASMIQAIPDLGKFNRDTVSSSILDEKYRGYIERSRRKINTRERLMSINISGIDSYMGIGEICWEAREALEKRRPASLGEAAMLPGVRNADIEGLIVYLSRIRSTRRPQCST
jgi:tRNA uridine 5-carboxymethylaminomethyl modification enzyme